MADAPETAKLAVLIDADNAQPGLAGALMAEIAKYGTASVKRAYGDWTKPNLTGWKKVLAEHAIQPSQQFGYTTGKNATDGAMIIDAMDLLYTDRFDAFCIVSSDSDFTGLAMRIRANGLKAYGFGERKTPIAFRKACTRFIYSDVLGVETPVIDEEPAEVGKPEPAGVEKKEKEKAVDKPPAKTSAKALRNDKELMPLVRSAIEAFSDEDGWANLGGVGSYIAKQAPDFDARNWGYKKLLDLDVAIGQFDVDQQKQPDGKSKAVRLREKRKG